MSIRRLLPALLALIALPLQAASREVRIATADPSVTLAGTLLLPDDAPAAPLAILITGSGNHVRDQVISGAPMFRQLAEGLLAAGIGSLRVDSRGSGESTGPKALDSAPMDRVADMRAVVRWARAEVPGARLGLVGHSEGASIAAELAAEPGVAWLVLLGAPARSGHEVWVEQQTAAVASASQGDADLTARGRALLEEAAQAAIGGADRETLEGIGLRLFALVGEDEASVRESGDLDQFTSRMTDPWMRGFLAYDPAPALQAIAVPALAVYGGLDTLTSPAQNAGRLVELMARGRTRALALHILPDEDHFFLRGDGLPPGTHRAGKMALSPVLVPLLAHWIHGIAPRP